MEFLDTYSVTIDYTTKVVTFALYYNVTLSFKYITKASLVYKRIFAKIKALILAYSITAVEVNYINLLRSKDYLL